MEPITFDHTAAKAYSEYVGLGWDQPSANRFDRIAARMGLEQEDFDKLMTEYTWRTKCLFDPTFYSWSKRVLIALRFINPFAKET